MTTKRGLTAAAAAGAAGVLLFTGSALACSIGDFSVDSAARCDTSTGVPMAAITITDKDASGTAADIAVEPHLASGLPGRVLATVHIDHPTAAGVSRTVLVEWEPGAQWDVRVTAGPLHDQLIPGYPTSADAPCTVATPTPTKAPVPVPTGKPIPAPSSSATPAPTSSAPAAAAGAPSASPTGRSLAETGGGSSTGVLTAFAGALIAIGGGALFMLRRRTAPVRR